MKFRDYVLLACCLAVDVSAVIGIYSFDHTPQRPLGEIGEPRDWASLPAVILFFSSLYVQLQGIERLMDKRREKEFPAPKLPGDAWQQAPLDGFPRNGEPLN